MRSMIVGCTLLVLGSCAAFAQQDPVPAQGGSPNAPAAAAPTTPAAAAASPMAGGNTMSKMQPTGGMSPRHHSGMMRHRQMAKHHKMRMMHHGKMMMHHKKMMHHHMHKAAPGTM